MTDTFITGTKLINEVVRTVCHTYLLLEEIISFPHLIIFGFSSWGVT